MIGDLIDLFKFLTTSLLSFCGIFAWPLTILIVIYTFREQISNYINSAFPYKLNLPGGLGIENKQKEQEEKSKEATERTINPDAKTVDLLIKSLDDTQRTKENLTQRNLVLELKLHFEFIHNYIFSSQYNLLQLIQKSETGSISLEEVTRYYMALPLSKKTDWNTASYLDFLVKTELIVVDSQGVKLTDVGKAYLQYSAGVPMPFINS